MTLHRRFLVLGCLIATGFCATAHAGVVSVLAAQKDLTPESLIRSFAGFTFELSAQPQDAETFLQRKRGDCDDFANLASRLLTDRGFQAKLVVVVMEQQSHVVCYVKEARGFLDFNHRADAHPIIESDGSLEDIAQKVAGDFRSRWQMASEFNYKNNRPVYLDNVFPSPAAPAMKQRRGGANDLGSLQTVSLVPIGPDGIAQIGNTRFP